MKRLLSSIRNMLRPRRTFSSAGYWERRYRSGGNSGPGSYNHLAEFKAEVLNGFVAERKVESVVEFGCGDGNQLTLAKYPSYVGYDLSPVAVAGCKRRFAGDSSKRFHLASEYDGRRADLALSLDVVFHLTEDEVFDQYMRRLFGAASRYVIVYSSNQDEPIEPVSVHVRHRQFTRWVQSEMPSEWVLLRNIPNRYPYTGDSEATSFADFYIYEKS
jgi:SAM-dependent methyltransferase